MATATSRRKDTSVMDQLLRESPQVLRVKPGELVEGIVVFRGKNKLLLDIQGVATGIVSGRELRDSFNTFKDLKMGEPVSALVLEEENDEGMVVLSLRMASQQKAWDKFHRLVESDATMKFVAQEANKGGLLANIDGIRTFLPVSQLAPVNYPRVNNADASEIINRLQKFIGHTFTVKIITMDEGAGKIVVSEREALSEERAKALEHLKVGDVKDGLVSGIVKFGLFVSFEGLEGLVHISEIAWGHVKNPAEHAEVGNKVTVKVIGVDGEKLSLSIKQLTKDPWEEIAERYPVGKKVQGTVVRFADYGAFLKLEKDINGLVHLSELAHHRVTDPAEVLTIGQKVDAQVINIDVDERRIGLSVKALKPIDKETMERLKREREEDEAKRLAQVQAQQQASPPAAGAESADETMTKSGTSKKHPQSAADGEAVANGKKTAATAAEGTEKESASEAAFVASKTGKKFYPINSAAAKKIKEENRVYFRDGKEAEAAGYSA
ncbi:S1 RNA-binding domain-containing protein [Candidatus Peregrinibacteria bacterium]|nr:S1 RNA-binding domain-containing protein [Candidatus Peregrinibacteria bacterium]